MKKMSTSDVVFVLALVLFFAIGVLVMRGEDPSIHKNKQERTKVNNNGSTEY